ncbi:ROK family protein [soil metagenome]
MSVGRIALGIDVGGTGIKAAVVDLDSGGLASSRIRVKTPSPSTPTAVAEVIAGIVDRLASEVDLPPSVPVGCGVPGVVLEGQVMTVANIDPGWLEVSAEEVLGQALGRRMHVLNDADAAGIAEMAFGVGRGWRGTVLMLTIGTGIGSAVFRDGVLLPNTEFGHLKMGGRDAETRLSGTARERRGLKWRIWASEFNLYLERVETLLWPDLIILGGGVAKAFGQYAERLKARAPIAVAEFLNASGIVGAALHAAEHERLVEPVLPVAAPIEAVIAGDGR